MFLFLLTIDMYTASSWTTYNKIQCGFSPPNNSQFSGSSYELYKKSIIYQQYFR